MLATWPSGTDLPARVGIDSSETIDSLSRSSASARSTTSMDSMPSR
jgi:hypothetical protein